jgi:hypothetical protein
MCAGRCCRRVATLHESLRVAVRISPNITQYHLIIRDRLAPADTSKLCPLQEIHAALIWIRCFPAQKAGEATGLLEPQIEHG